ncbi:MAG: type I restriction enzyme HsdR N-terminal domain-containing protein [Desulfomicrobium escambiense]|nr:type I restriction enzyme HsdR N-terminal domain-containing protein [Desulfomicrobium escambiense]
MLDDTLDERYRQKIAELLVNHKGYLTARTSNPGVSSGCRPIDRRAVIKVDFVVRVAGQRRPWSSASGRASLVSRERPALAVSRLVEAYQVPIAVVTNGEDAEVMAAHPARSSAAGCAAIPSRSELLA